MQYAWLIWQIAAFGVTAAAGLLLVRPVAKRHLRRPAVLRSGTAALVGREATVLAGEREARILSADGQAQAIQRVFAAVHEGNPDPKVLAYQYLQTLPELAKSGNTFCVVPSELTGALQSVSGAFKPANGG